MIWALLIVGFTVIAEIEFSRRRSDQRHIETLEAMKALSTSLSQLRDDLEPGILARRAETFARAAETLAKFEASQLPAKNA